MLPHRRANLDRIYHPQLNQGMLTHQNPTVQKSTENEPKITKFTNCTTLQNLRSTIDTKSANIPLNAQPCRNYQPKLHFTKKDKHSPDCTVIPHQLSSPHRHSRCKTDVNTKTPNSNTSDSRVNTRSLRKLSCGDRSKQL